MSEPAMSEDGAPKPLQGVELLASALHAQLLMRRRATLEHDIKNVVHGLLSGTELLSKALHTNAARISPAECLSLLQQQLGRAQTTLNRMLEDIAPSDVAISTIDLAAVVQDCTHAVRHQLQTLTVQVSVEPGSKVRIQAARFKDLLMSILLGCVDQATERSRCELSAASEPMRVILTIRHSLSSDAPLANGEAIREVLAADDIHMSVSASAHERRIELSIPRVVEDVSAADLTAIVIVDGNRDAADSLAMLTQIEGYDPVASYDVDSALNAVKSRMPAAVLVDLDGSVDSAMLIRKIRTDSINIRLIGLSHSSTRRNGDADAYLGKPLDLRALRKILDSPQ